MAAANKKTEENTTAEEKQAGVTTKESANADEKAKNDDVSAKDQAAKGVENGGDVPEHPMDQGTVPDDAVGNQIVSDPNVDEEDVEDDSVYTPHASFNGVFQYVPGHEEIVWGSAGMTEEIRELYVRAKGDINKYKEIVAEDAKKVRDDVEKEAKKVEADRKKEEKDN